MAVVWGKRLLVAVLCLGLSAHSGARSTRKSVKLDGEGENMFINLEGDTNSSEIIHSPGEKWEDHSYRHAARTLWKYQEENPEFAEGVMIFWFSGLSLLLIGVILLLYSEDFRRRLMNKSLLKEGDSLQELEAAEQRVSSQRPYVSVSGGLFLIGGVACGMYPFCDIFAIIGWDIAPCFLVLTFGSIFVTASLYCVLVGLCWLCTRIFASTLLISVAFIGMTLLPAGNPLFLTIWFLLSAAVIYFYFFYASRLYKAGEKPVWLQTLDVTPEPEKAKNTNA